MMLRTSSRLVGVVIGLTALLPLGCGGPERKPTAAISPAPTPKATRAADPKPPTLATAPEEVMPLRTAEFVTNQGQRLKLAADGDPWADRVVSFTQGKPPATDATNPRGALGKPDYDDVKQHSRTYLAMGNGGELVVEFVDNVLIDGDGDDLAVFEIGPAVEPIDVAISTDGKTWIEVGRVKGAHSTLDIGPHVKREQRFRFVRLTDSKAGLSNNSKWPGADLDAVGAINTRSLRTKP